MFTALCAYHLNEEEKQKTKNPSNVPEKKSENPLLEHTLTAFQALVISLLPLSFGSLDQPSVGVLAIFHLAF